MVKVSESRSTARRAILRKCAAVMPFLSQPTPQDSVPAGVPAGGPAVGQYAPAAAERQ